MVKRFLIVAWSFYNDYPVSWIGAKNISGLWSWTEPVNTPLTYDPVWSLADPNGGYSLLCILFYYEWFADEPCISSLSVGVFCEHYDIPLFTKHSETA